MVKDIKIKNMRIIIIIIGIFCIIINCYDLSFSQGGRIKMQNVKKNICDVWKGIPLVNFKGRITNLQTNEPIERFSVCEIVNGTIQKGQLYSQGKSIDLGPQTIKTNNGYYQFSLYLATLNGQVRYSNSKRFRVLGPESESLIIQISSEGYQNKRISITKDKVLPDDYNFIDITLDPITR